MSVVKETLNAVKKGLTWRVIVTTGVTVTALKVTEKFAKQGTFGTKVAELTNKYL